MQELTSGEVVLWAHRLFFMPGDAFIAHVGPTSLGAYLGLTHASLGSATAAWISGALWLLAVWAVFCVFGLVVDTIDPTYRQQRREERKARAQARRELRARGRSSAPSEPAPAPRIEPTLPADFQPDAELHEADARAARRARVA
jgi:hypothetical protein